MDSITALFAPILRASWYAFALAACVALGLPTTTWREQTPERVLVDMAARMLEILSVAVIEAYRGMFLRYARGDWLTLLAVETYETPRLEATFASCLATLDNNSINTYNVPAGDTIAVGKTGIDTPYVIDGPLTIAPGLLEDVPVRCLIAGTVGNAAIGEIDQIIGQQFAGVEIGNTTEATARDIELDADLAPRARLATGPTSPAGAAAAYEYVAQGGDLGGTIDEEIAEIGITEVKLITDLATGSVTAYYRKATSAPSSPEVDTLNQKMLEKVVPAGVDFLGLAAQAVIVDIDINVRVLASLNVTEQEVKDAVDDVLEAYFPEIPIHAYPYVPDVPNTGELTTNKIVGIIEDATVGDIKVIHYAGASLTPGGATTDFATGEFAVLGTVTTTVTFS